MFDSLSSSSCVLNEQIARQIFDILPESDCLMVIIDKEGNCWPSDSKKFHDINIDEQLLKSFCGRIDDGSEPIVTQVGNYGVVVAELATQRLNCGYIMIGLGRYDAELILKNINLIEVVLRQINLIAELIEKNNHL